VFLGRDFGEERDYGDKVAEEIDHAVKVLMNEAYELAVKSIMTHKPKLVMLAEYLIEHETVSGESMNRLFNAEGESGTEPGSPVVPPETPPSLDPTPPPAHSQPAAPRPAPSLSSTSGEGDS